MLDDIYWMISFLSCWRGLLMGPSPASSSTTALTLSWLKPMSVAFLWELVSLDSPFLVALQLLLQ